MEMEVMRKDELIDLALTPLQTEDGSYKLGIWVRDNIQGIGTLTYVDQKGTFAALGHGISDVDTGERLDISQETSTMPGSYLSKKELQEIREN